MEPDKTHSDPVSHKSTGFARLWKAFFHSFNGLADAYRHESAFRQEVVLSLILIPVSLLLQASGLGHALMISSVMLILITELLNSAIEATIDRFSTENHILAKRAKDIGSAAVLLSIVNLVAVWGFILV